MSDSEPDYGAFVVIAVILSILVLLLVYSCGERLDAKYEFQIEKLKLEQGIYEKDQGDDN